ncbi:MAG: hypothetical protein WAL24_04885, partial [Nitrososphaeraceae archaeon]
RFKFCSNSLEKLDTMHMSAGCMSILNRCYTGNSVIRVYVTMINKVNLYLLGTKRNAKGNV